MSLSRNQSQSHKQRKSQSGQRTGISEKTHPASKPRSAGKGGRKMTSLERRVFLLERKLTLAFQLIQVGSQAALRNYETIGETND